MPVLCVVAPPILRISLSFFLCRITLFGSLNKCHNHISIYSSSPVFITRPFFFFAGLRSGSTRRRHRLRRDHYGPNAIRNHSHETLRSLWKNLISILRFWSLLPVVAGMRVLVTLFCLHLPMGIICLNSFFVGITFLFECDVYASLCVVCIITLSTTKLSFHHSRMI